MNVKRIEENFDPCEAAADSTPASYTLVQRNRWQQFHLWNAGNIQPAYRTCEFASGSGWNCTSLMACAISRFFMKYCQQKPVRRFSAMMMLIPWSMPRMSSANQFALGLKASTKP